MEIFKFDYNSLDDLVSNTYIVSDDDFKCVVIDPGIDNNKVKEFIEKHHLNLVGVLLTHGHIDHIRGVDHLAKSFQCPVFIHELDEEMLRNPKHNLSAQLLESRIVNSEITSLKDNEELNLFKEKIIVIHTPFHTKGSVCYYFPSKNALFTGDTLFKESIGRDDLPCADPSKTKESLNKIKKLPKETVIYPGHGMNSNLESELLNNHFLID